MRGAGVRGHGRGQRVTPARPIFLLTPGTKHKRPGINRHQWHQSQVESIQKWHNYHDGAGEDHLPSTFLESHNLLNRVSMRSLESLLQNISNQRSQVMHLPRPEPAIISTSWSKWGRKGWRGGRVRFTLMTVIQLYGERCLGHERHNMEIFSAEILSIMRSSEGWLTMDVAGWCCLGAHSYSLTQMEKVGCRLCYVWAGIILSPQSGLSLGSVSVRPRRRSSPAITTLRCHHASVSVLSMMRISGDDDDDTGGLWSWTLSVSW